jgi:hypothetical protein
MVEMIVKLTIFMRYGGNDNDDDDDDEDDDDDDDDDDSDDDVDDDDDGDDDDADDVVAIGCDGYRSILKASCLPLSPHTRMNARVKKLNSC